MKLCRFELAEMPGTPRTGIYHEGKVYETDGTNAIGVHATSAVQFLPPMGQPTSVRVFRADGSYHYANAGSVTGPSSSLSILVPDEEISVELSVGIVLKDHGMQLDAEEAMDVVLGFTNVIRVVAGASDDFPLAIGPFIHTIDEVADVHAPWAWSLKINGESVGSGSGTLAVNPVDALVACSRTNAVFAGDLIVLPAFETGPLPQLRTGDQVQFALEQLGFLSTTLD